MDQQTAAKQQIVERLKQANNVLVTVSHNPTVDQLAACIGVTLFLNKLDKHATAVFSGQVPSTIEFLQPEKTIETNTDSLRDFIISLDKAKADKLRYKVEDKFVRIYITPYRTSLSEKDLVFSQGDFNVEVVLALGVKDRTQLDAAITQHGRILHDATVISVNAGQDKSPPIGQINWQEPTASSLCEMLVSISEAFGAGLIDNQMATAFLTGIVAETQRFSNPKTSPKVMTMAAQLMAAGANQQLIVSKLEPPPPPPEAAKPVQPKAPPKPKPPVPSDTLVIPHEEEKAQEVEVKPGEIHIDKYGNIISSEEVQAAANDLKAQAAPKSELPAALSALPTALATAEPEAPTEPETPAESTVSDQPTPLPTLESTPTIPVVEEKLPEVKKETKTELPAPVTKPTLSRPRALEPEADAGEAPRPHTMLNPYDHQPAISPPFTADTQPSWYDPENTLPTDPLSESERPDDALIDGKKATSKPDLSEEHATVQPISLSSATSVYPEPESSGTPTFPTPTVDNARSAVNSAISSAPFDPGFSKPIESLNAVPAASDLARPAPPPVPPPLPQATVSAVAHHSKGKVTELAKPL